MNLPRKRAQIRVRPCTITDDPVRDIVLFRIAWTGLVGFVRIVCYSNIYICIYTRLTLFPDVGWRMFRRKRRISNKLNCTPPPHNSPDSSRRTRPVETCAKSLLHAAVVAGENDEMYTAGRVLNIRRSRLIKVKPKLWILDKQKTPRQSVRVQPDYAARRVFK